MPKTIIKQAHRILFYVLLSALNAGLAVAAESAAVIDRVMASGTLRVGVALYSPSVMRSNKGEELQGFDIDVANRLAKELNVKPEFIELPWQQLPDAITAGKVDMVISGMTVTLSRNLKGLFSIPYSRTNLVLLARRDAVSEEHTEVADFNSPAMRVAVLEGTVEERLAKEQLPDAIHAMLSSQTAQVEALVSGKANIAFFDRSKAQALWQQHSELLFLPLDDVFFRGQEAIMLPRGDTDTLNLVNNWILQRLADGWLQERHDHWYISPDASEE